MAEPSIWPVSASRAVLLSLAVAGCALVAPDARPDDQAAPVLVTVRVVNADGSPVPGSRVAIQIFDDPDAGFGQSGAIVDQTYTSGGDGTFAIHYEPTPKLRDLARARGGVVMFQAFATFDDRVYPWGMSRALGSDGWAGEPVTMDVTRGDRDHSFPAPSSATPPSAP